MIKHTSKGYILLQTLVFGAISLMLIGAIVSWVGRSFRNTKALAEREQAFYIAEAGIEYYRWHLAHAQQDFTDGSTTAGVYKHAYKDTSGNTIGEFHLRIIPPAVGSTLVTVISSGTVASSTVSSRAVEAKLAIPSLAKFSFVANTPMRFGEGTEIFGDLHSNDGVRFDGVAHGVITSAKPSYDDPDHSGGSEFGVHTHVNVPPTSGSNDTFRPLEAPPQTVSDRPDVFIAGRQFPVPAIDFTGLITTLAGLKTQAQSASRYFAHSGASGYLAVLKTDDTFDVYRVNSLTSLSSQCDTASMNAVGWGSWSINTKTLIGNYSFPANGVVFFEDNLWVEGTISSARLTLASGRFPENTSTQTSITVNNNLRYTNFDGTDVLALIAQNNINVGLKSLDTLRIDAALLAKNGRVGRYHYGSNKCGVEYNRSSVTVYGTMGSNQRYGFAYTDNTGYDTRTIIYDGNLLYSPPPSFPLAGDQYSTVSWREL